MNVLAIDPGLSGAAVAIGPATIQVQTNFKHVEDLTRAIDTFGKWTDVAVIELVAARPGQGVASMFEFGRTSGVALGALQSNGFSTFDRSKKKLIEVAPQKWQNFWWKMLDSENDTDPLAIHPFDSVGFVRRFYPVAEPHLVRKKDHNTADALLMALWYVCTEAAEGSYRERDRKRLKWLLDRYNCP